MADGKTDRTVGDIGEFALIERLVSDVRVVVGTCDAFCKWQSGRIKG